MSAPPDVPTVVARAFDASRRRGYASFCRNETGRLLATLAAASRGTVAEFGTGCGVGTAWLRSGVRNGAHILTAERDPRLATAAAEIFRDDDHVEVLQADWSLLHERGPYSLVFLDSGEPEAVRAVLAGESGADSVGLGNVDARLRQAFGDRHGLVVETAPGAGTKVTFRVPKYAPGVHPSA